MVAFIKTLDILFEVMFWLILARVLMSWLPIGKGGKISALIYQLTDPIITPVRAIIYSLFPKMKYSGLDFSPMATVLLLEFLRRIIISLLVRLWI
jgi:YggT family protein